MRHPPDLRELHRLPQWSLTDSFPAGPTDPKPCFWTGKNPDLSKQRLDDQTKSDFIRLAQKTFGTMEKNFKLVARGTSLIDGVVLQAAPGHTPGHTALRIQSYKQELLHIFDLAQCDSP